MSAVTCEARPKTTFMATSLPDNAPLMMSVSASTVPLTEPLSPTVILPAVRLPETVPPIWTSPVQAISPSTRKPSLKIDGTRRRCTPLVLLLAADLNHILPYFHELCRVERRSVHEDL